MLTLKRSPPQSSLPIMDNSHEADIKTFTARKSFSFAHLMLIWLTGKTNTNLQVSQTFIILLYRGAQMICTEENECDVILGIKSRLYVLYIAQWIQKLKSKCAKFDFFRFSILCTMKGILKKKKKFH